MTDIEKNVLYLFRHLADDDKPGVLEMLYEMQPEIIVEVNDGEDPYKAAYHAGLASGLNPHESFHETVKLMHADADASDFKI